MACPACPKNRRDPDEAWSGPPLNRMNCVVYPPPSARCGKNCCPEGGCASSVGWVVVRRKFPRSLYRPRIPMTEIPGEDDVETRSTPWNGLGTLPKPGI